MTSDQKNVLEPRLIGQRLVVNRRCSCSRRVTKLRVSLRARGQGWEQGGKGLVDVVHRRAVERCSRALMPIFVSFLDPAGVLVGANTGSKTVENA
jgi:hypothetical protein